MRWAAAGGLTTGHGVPSFTIMRRHIALLATILVLLGPLGLGGLHHAALHTPCAGAEDSCPGESTAAPDAAHLQSLGCWICSAVHFTSGVVAAPELIAVDRIVVAERRILRARIAAPS